MSAGIGSPCDVGLCRPRATTKVAFFLLWLSLLPQPARAPIPCGPDLTEPAEVGGFVRNIGPSKTILHAESQARDCSFVTRRYEGKIIITCDEGSLNITTEGCSPRRCQTWMSLSVRIGEVSVSASPLNVIASGDLEWRLCRNLNAVYRGKYIMFCNYGELSVDTSRCVTQWDSMNPPPWEKRSRHYSLGLVDGAVLMLGGLGNAGPLREVWQWDPIPGSVEGTWTPTKKIPPWSGRFGIAAVRQEREAGEQVLIFGGNDNQNRRDIWRWLRHPAIVSLLLEESNPTGTQARDCAISDEILRCHAQQGVSGRKWHISHYLEESTEVHLDVLHDAGPGGVPPGAVGTGAMLIAIELDTCRQIFRAEGGSWSTTGCTGVDPPWARAEEASIRLGPHGAAYPGQRRQLRFFLDRVRQEIVLYSNGVPMIPPGAAPGQLGVPVGGGGCRDYGLVMQDENDTVIGSCPNDETPVANMYLRVIEAVVWPEARLELRSLRVKAPAGYWQPITDETPWPSRSSHAVVGLPDGDILLMGGVGESGLLNDVWRWTPRQCTLLPDMYPLAASRYAMECVYPCKSSPLYGQWYQLRNAPWAARQEHAAVWTVSGVILLGGRTAQGFENDVWKWSYYGPFCSITWQGKWQQITRTAPWEPRHGMSLVGFPRPGETEPETILIIGGFGGHPPYSKVIRAQSQADEDKVMPRNDIWCANKDFEDWRAWTEIAPKSPFSPRAQSAAVIAPSIADFSMIFFGGYDDNARLVADQWRWTGENNTFQCATDTLGAD